MSKIVDFTDTTAFGRAIKNVKNANGLDVCTLKPSYIYRSGDLNNFCFFSDIETISPYMRESRPVIKYKTPKDVKLLIFNWKNIITVLSSLPPEAIQVFDRYIVDPETKTIFPASPYEGTYLNKLFAMLVCELGFDGWIANTDCDVQQQNINFDRSDLPNNVVVFKTNPYYPEIMLCEPSDENVVKTKKSSANAGAFGKTAGAFGKTAGAKKRKPTTARSGIFGRRKTLKN